MLAILSFNVALNYTESINQAQESTLSDRISKKRRLNMFFSEKIRVQTACLEKTPFARVLLEKVLKKNAY